MRDGCVDHNGKLLQVPVADILPTLGANARKLARVVMEGSELYFKKGDQVSPAFFYIKDGQLQHKAFQFEDDDDKDRAAEWMREMRATVPEAAFITEAWFATMKKGDSYVPARLHPDREEVLLLQVWEGRRLITVKATLSRNPDRVGPWIVFYDTNYTIPNGPEKVAGRMVEGPPCQSMEDN